MSMNSRVLIPLMVLGVALMLASCGDDESPTAPSTPPTASVLSVATDSTNSAATSWSMCDDTDFSEYRLYRATTSGISQNPPSSPIHVTSTASETSYMDIGLEWGETYYYALQTRDTEGLNTWSNEVVAVIPDSSGGGGGGDALTCYEVQGQTSASPYDGETVTVTGIVVVAGGEWYSSGGAYAVIMDADGGPWSGLTIYGSDIAGLARGDSVTVTGMIDEYFYLTEMTFPYTEVTVESTGHALPAPEALGTGDVGEEQWESVLVSVSDVTVTEDDLGFGEWSVDDSSGDLRVDDLGDYSYTPSIGDTFEEIIGVCWYSFDNWKIEPRDDADLID